MDRARFETLVAEALDEIPEPFRATVDEVAVVIEDEPSGALLRELGMDPQRETLFGLYEGTPLSEREQGGAGLLPDRITIFYRPLVRAFGTPAAIRREIRKTVIHEIAHCLGLEDGAIEAEGY